MAYNFLTNRLCSLHCSTAHSTTKVIFYGALNKTRSVCCLNWGSNPVSQHNKLSPYFWFNVLVAKLNVLVHTPAELLQSVLYACSSLCDCNIATHLYKQIKYFFLVCPLLKGWILLICTSFETVIGPEQSFRFLGKNKLVRISGN